MLLVDWVLAAEWVHKKPYTVFRHRERVENLCTNNISNMLIH